MSADGHGSMHTTITVRASHLLSRHQQRLITTRIDVDVAPSIFHFQTTGHPLEPTVVDPDPSRPRIAWGNFAQLSFMYPDGEKVSHTLAGGFATATLDRSGTGSSLIPPADTDDIHHVRNGVSSSHEKLPGSLTW